MWGPIVFELVEINPMNTMVLSVIPVVIIEGKLEVKLPTNRQMEKQRWEESERRRKEVRRSGKRKSEKKEDAGARKGRKVAIHCVFSNDLWLWRVKK